MLYGIINSFIQLNYIIGVKSHSNHEMARKIRNIIHAIGNQHFRIQQKQCTPLLNLSIICIYLYLYLTITIPK